MIDSGDRLTVDRMIPFPPFRILPVFLALITPTFAEEKPDIERPADRVVTSKGTDLGKLIAPYIEMSRKEFPEAIKRFQQGLPAGHVLYVTVLITDPDSKEFEQVFVEVTGIEGETISGTIASDISRLTKIHAGDPYQVHSKEVRDWTITSPDGKEEGNYVGKFLDVYQDGIVPLVFEIQTDEDGSVSSAKFLQAINRYKQDVSYCIPGTAKKEAERIISEMTYKDADHTKPFYSYVIYHFHEDRVEKPQQTSDKAE